MFAVDYINSVNGLRCKAYFGDREDTDRFVARLKRCGHSLVAIVELRDPY